MKNFFLKIVFAFVLPFFMATIIAEHCSNLWLRTLYFTIPWMHQTGFLLCVFFFHNLMGDLLSTLLGWAQKIIGFAAESLGQIVARISKYRAGQIVLGVAAVLLALTFIKTLNNYS